MKFDDKLTADGCRRDWRWLNAGRSVCLVWRPCIMQQFVVMLKLLDLFFLTVSWLLICLNY